jgi:imidazolonepropionase-like amidohydrolase
MAYLGWRPATTGAVAVLLACQAATATTTSDDPPRTDGATALAIVDVTIVPMGGDRTIPHQTVIVRGGRIDWIGPAAERRAPEGAVVISGANRYVMPSLIDMHVHLRTADLPAYLANGVTTVRNMWGTPEVARLRSEIASGVRLGPTIISASPGLDGTPPQWPGTLIVTSPNTAAAVVQAQRDAGWGYVKVYTRLDPSAFDAIMAAAKASGIAPIGHVPLAVDVRHAIAMGMRSIEHLTGYDRAVSASRNAGTFGWADADTTRFASLVADTKAAAVWNCPTLAIYAALAQQHSAAERERILRNRRRFIAMLSEVGAPLLAGTDAGIDVVGPGTSMHDELTELTAAGLTPYRALRAATVDAARFLERADLGVVAIAAQADLLLLDGDPLRDVRNARRIAGVIIRGAWIPAAELPRP